MIKQRFVVYKAFNKSGGVVGSLLVAGGKLMPFTRHTWASDLSKTTSELMGYGTFDSLDYWKSYTKRCGACRFQKVIYFN
ncbi:hypothetical protein [Aeromonas phage Aer_P220]|uniref:Uncharacterized protein n=1 Tax=Aeromonas phage Aer_P220 TaxID=2951227 RepID=A0A9E7NLS7_9CAUD|nr:hypothetical protein [Aeromonas phage Aer_P220]